jgi:hypothetical protein
MCDKDVRKFMQTYDKAVFAQRKKEPFVIGARTAALLRRPNAAQIRHNVAFVAVDSVHQHSPITDNIN